jgi:HSP20 family protein
MRTQANRQTGKQELPRAAFARPQGDTSMLSPFYDFPFDRITREMARQFDLVTRVPREEAATAFPVFDLYEKDDAFVFACELPGVTKEDLTLTIEGDVVAIAAKREVSPPEGFTARVRERSGFAFERSFKLGARVAADAADAKLENGVLTLTLPKAKEREPLKIAVKTA